MQADLVITNGHVIDPANGVDAVCDVVIKDGVIADVGADLARRTGSGARFDASGCVVTPGLIDVHVHAYEHATPLGVNVDRRCLGRGVTSVVDAGSAGAGTFPGLRKFIAERSRTRLLAFLHIAAHGMAAAGCAGFGAGGECDSINQLNVDLCVKCIRDNPDLIVGVKVRLTADVCNDGENEADAYRRALSVCEQTGLPLMTHHTFSTVPLAEVNGGLGCPGSLRAGDLYTHCLHGYPSSVLDAHTRRLHPSVVAARDRGVLFDVGHGQGSFSWTVAEECAKQSFFPDVITTDLHSGNVNGPVYDLPTTMSKLLNVGMTLAEVIKAVTLTPAKALRRDAEIGSLTKGRCADVTVLKLNGVDLNLEDSQGQIRKVKQLLTPVAVWSAGCQYDIVELDVFPNRDKLASLREPWGDLIIRDPTAPTLQAEF